MTESTKGHDKAASEVCPDCGRPIADRSGTGGSLETHCFGHRDGDALGQRLCRDNTIAKLRAEVESLRARVAEREWVPCSERMPRDGWRVLGLYQSFGGPRVVACFRDPDESVTKRWTADGGTQYGDGIITHWREMPRPPSDPETKATKGET
jgi:hypothetical protein